MFWVIKTQHEGRDGDFPRKVEGRFFEIGKKTSIMCSVFLHKNVQHAMDEWWISWRGERGPTQHPLSISPRSDETTKTTKRRLPRPDVTISPDEILELRGSSGLEAGIAAGAEGGGTGAHASGVLSSTVYGIGSE